MALFPRGLRTWLLTVAAPRLRLATITSFKVNHIELTWQVKEIAGSATSSAGPNESSFRTLAIMAV
jgi:hypothetical protein